MRSALRTEMEVASKSARVPAHQGAASFAARARRQKHSYPEAAAGRVRRGRFSVSEHRGPRRQPTASLAAVTGRTPPAWHGILPGPRPPGPSPASPRRQNSHHPGAGNGNAGCPLPRVPRWRLRNDRESAAFESTRAWRRGGRSRPTPGSPVRIPLTLAQRFGAPTTQTGHDHPGCYTGRHYHAWYYVQAWAGHVCYWKSVPRVYCA